MDEIQQYVNDFAVTSQSSQLWNLQTFLREEQYDTESIRIDIHGNINEIKFGKEIPNLLKEFIKTQEG